VRGEGHRHYGEPKRARSWKRRTQPRGYLQAPMIPRLLGKRIGNRLPTIFQVAMFSLIRFDVRAVALDFGWVASGSDVLRKREARSRNVGSQSRRL